MKVISAQRRSHYFLILISFFILNISGCTSLRFVADYDENIDRGITALQKETESLLLVIESNVGGYAINQKRYREIKVEISSLRLRADAIQRNSLTVKMLDKLLNNINRLESDHKEGISRAEVPLYRGALNSQFTAILTFELAKRRGEKIDESQALAPATVNSN